MLCHPSVLARLVFAAAWCAGMSLFPVAARAAEACNVFVNDIVAAGDGNVYAVQLGSYVPRDVKAVLFLRGRTRKYSLPWSGGIYDEDSTVRSDFRLFEGPVFYVKTSEKILISWVQPLLDDGSPSACATQGTVVSEDAGDVDATLVAALHAYGPQSAVTEATYLGSVPPPACSDPYVNAAVDGVASVPAYPASAEKNRVTGVVEVQISLSASGAVESATVFTSSGDESLDDAAIAAAKRTKYHPRIYDCHPIASKYLFRAEFAGE